MKRLVVFTVLAFLGFAGNSYAAFKPPTPPKPPKPAICQRVVHPACFDTPTPPPVVEHATLTYSDGELFFTVRDLTPGDVFYATFQAWDEYSTVPYLRGHSQLVVRSDGTIRFQVSVAGELMPYVHELEKVVAWIHRSINVSDAGLDSIGQPLGLATYYFNYD